MVNFRIPTVILNIADNVDDFLIYNWPESIRDFLNKVLEKKLTAIETTTSLLQRRVEALELFIFELREERNLQIEAIEKFLVDHFPAAFKPYQSGKPGESSSRTIIENNMISPSPSTIPEEVDIAEKETILPVVQEEEPLASSSHTGIARRVQRRIDKKRKVVELSFTRIFLEYPSEVDDMEVETTKIDKGTDKRRPDIEDKVPPASTYIVEAASESKIEAWPAELILNYQGRNDIIYTRGNIILYRSQIDKLLKLEYIDTNHINAFDILLYHLYKADTTTYVSHITQESIGATNLMLVPIINKFHWTLIISHLYDEIKNSFDQDIRMWPI
ncbi:hypothetical protein IEQ34_022552 [Dendrobium chrysotoxum]|uniref:Ubiquitin-like protease family profile domain-containing protein n=1 Tax=Dendrobium chrysotoxum TaxID=161865 RepID=A0AAV7FY09_DENCH|nr:hypothetical protein IEQ34_022552 [Dendrobium chrysotoxum]